MAQVDDSSPSVVVQQALNALTASKHRLSAVYAVQPDLDSDLAKVLDAARKRLVNEARELYQDGYRAGADLAGKLHYRQLEYLVRTGLRKAAGSMARMAYDIDTGRADDLPDGARPLVDPDLLVPTLGSLADYTGVVEWTPEQPTVEGMTRALEDVWAALREEEAMPGP